MELCTHEIIRLGMNKPLSETHDRRRPNGDAYIGFERVCYKSVFGYGRKARHSKAQSREAATGCHFLNRMAEHG